MMFMPFGPIIFFSESETLVTTAMFICRTSLNLPRPFFRMVFVPYAICVANGSIDLVFFIAFLSCKVMVGFYDRFYFSISSMAPGISSKLLSFRLFPRPSWARQMQT